MPEKICITPRCVFCQFEIDDGDDVAIDVGGSWQHKTTGQPATQLICDDLDCPHLQYGCHSYCLRVVGFDRSREFIEATKHSYIPTEQEESRRRRWIRHCLTLVLSKKYADEGLHLTPELCLLIADHLLQNRMVSNCAD
ncbi:hypothetical protein G6O67_007125 [Ophiocordyceps sinensis]|uniref:Uncharacterized protein n=1 Tax=Ophiocordyceps sinensis TaxID=72228 RepID=A0A8H4LTN2_9HYPO|nr:hypothetical protein G6O67_007125 [Ophiocordyceps sinensis]